MFLDLRGPENASVMCFFSFTPHSYQSSRTLTSQTFYRLGLYLTVLTTLIIYLAVMEI